MHPTRRDDLVVHSTQTGLLVSDPLTGAAHQLSPIAAAAFEACDGTADVAAVIARVRAARPEFAGFNDKHVWSALDELGSANLLAVRAAPPAGPVVDRRTLLRTMFAATGAAAAFGLAPLASSTAGAAKIAQEEKTKERAHEHARKDALKADKRDEQACKSQVSERRRSEEQAKAFEDPQYKQKEHAGKQAVRAKSEQAAKARRDVGLESGGDWRAPATLDAETGESVEGFVDVYSYRLGSDETGCYSTFELHLAPDLHTAAHEAAHVVQQMTRGGTVLVSFNDEPAFEAKITRATVGFTAFDAKGTPTEAIVVCHCTHL